MIRKYARAALVATLMMSAASATAMMAATSVAQAAEKVGKAVGAPLNEATKAMQVQDWATALAKTQEAAAIPTKNGYEEYTVNKFLGIVYVNMKDMTSATKYYLLAADSPSMPEEEKKDVWHNALLLAGQAKMYDKAVFYAKGLEAMGALDDALTAETAVAYYNLKDYPNAQTYAQKSIDMAKAAGKKPNEAAMQIVMGTQAKSNDQAGALKTLEQLAIDYNSADSWQQLTGLALSGKSMQPIDALYIFRLRYTSGAMKDSDDYVVYGSLGNQLGYSVEAKAILEQGISSGKLTSGQAGATLTKARNDAAMDQKAMNQIISSAKASKSGEQDVKLAEDLYGYGRYAEAEEAARRGIGKGGIKDASEGQMILGLALVAQGKNDEAITTLDQVSGSANRKRAAQIWSIYAQAKKKLAGASTAPAQ